jgi:hypothetical protein
MGCCWQAPLIAQPADIDCAWVLQLLPGITDADLEWFMERIAIKTDSGLTDRQARNETYDLYLSLKNTGYFD